MKRIVLSVICMFTLVSVFAQTHFQELTMKDALEKAKEVNKYVFVDCYTAWCGPCKMMADKIFPLENVGEYMNEHFVCVKFDMEKGEGSKIAQKYKVSSYPTFLVLKTDGSLVHRVIGGTATGEEFLKKLQEGLDENSSDKLEARYAAGERGLSFLVEYVKVLVRSCDVEKARNVAQELLASLDDEEKCSEPYWFIYQSLDLSPIGSGNMVYLLKHVNQFREGVGVEKVDSVIAILFEVQLEDILRGRNRDATLADVEASEKMFDSFHLIGKDYLKDYMALIKAVKSEKTKDVLKLYKKIFPTLPDGKTSYLYFAPLVELREKWTKQQKKELIAFTEEIRSKVQFDKLKASLGYFIKDIQELW